MSPQSLTYQELLQLIEIIKASSHFTEFHLKCGAIEVHLRRHVNGSAPPATPPVPRAVAAPAAEPAAPVPAPPVQPRTPQAAPVEYPEGAFCLTSPMVGTFYRAPEPGAPPFVEVGQQVETGTTVCIIEVMKLMNSLPAGHRGVVTHILVNDGEPVEFGQALLVIAPQ